MFNIFLDLSIKSAYWITKGIYWGGKRLIWGPELSKEDKIMLKLEEIETIETLNGKIQEIKVIESNIKEMWKHIQEYENTGYPHFDPNKKYDNEKKMK